MLTIIISAVEFFPSFHKVPLIYKWVMGGCLGFEFRTTMASRCRVLLFNENSFPSVFLGHTFHQSASELLTFSKILWWHIEELHCFNTEVAYEGQSGLPNAHFSYHCHCYNFSLLGLLVMASQKLIQKLSICQSPTSPNNHHMDVTMVHQVGLVWFYFIFYKGPGPPNFIKTVQGAKKPQGSQPWNPAPTKKAPGWMDWSDCCSWPVIG